MTTLSKIILKSAWFSPIRYFSNRHLLGNSCRTKGRDNAIHIGTSLLTGTSILIERNNNTVWIGDGLRLFQTKIIVKGNDCEIQLAGSGYFSGKIICGDIGSNIACGNGMAADGAVLVAREGSSIHIGNDCALASGVEIHSSDSHAIFDTPSGKRLNPAQNVEIQCHVWLAQGATILKGAIVGEGSVVGFHALVTQATPIPPHTIAAGIPARPIRPDIHWTR